MSHFSAGASAALPLVCHVDDHRAREPAHLPDPHSRLPDERPRFRTAGRPARGGGLPAGGGGRATGRGRVQHLCGAGERRQPALRQPRQSAPDQERDPRHADRRGRLPRAEGPAHDRRPRALGRRRLRHPQHRLAARPARAGESAAGRSGRDQGGSGNLPLQPPHPSRLGLRRLGVDQCRLQQHLHLLHRADVARQGDRPSTGRHPRRDRGTGRRGRAGGHTARPERERVRRRIRRSHCLREPAPVLRPGRGLWNGSGSPLHTRRISPTT